MSETPETIDPVPSLVERINAIQAKLKTFAKDIEVGQGASSYQATSYGAIAKQIRPLMAEYGVGFCITLDESSYTETGLNWGKNPLMRYIGKYTAAFFYEMHIAEGFSERMSFKVEAHALDAGDKAPGKALTYATKSALKTVFLVDTGDAEEARIEDAQEVVEAKASEVEVLEIINLADELFEDSETVIQNMLEFHKLKTIAEATKPQAALMKVQLQKKAKREANED